ncbi:MAG: YceH family protein [Planctomycetota bacterium]|nr:YceH family protein [Planctomycetota bacterium]
MIQLSPNESRVLSVLIEKAQTTPQQYPLTLNSLITGSNQKSNREPVLTLSEDDVLDAIDGLRVKGLMREVMLTGSRVQKFRHVAREGLDVGTNELVVLAELLMRGPQTVGELRTRASRMHPLESTDIVKNLLDHMMSLEEPMVRELPPVPGSRAARYVQLLCPNLHPLGATSSQAISPSARDASVPDLADRVEKLEDEVAKLTRQLQVLTQALGGTASPSDDD